MKLFDVMALVPVIEEAGGIITDWKGDNFINKEWDDYFNENSDLAIQIYSVNHELILVNFGIFYVPYD